MSSAGKDKLPSISKRKKLFFWWGLLIILVAGAILSAVILVNRRNETACSDPKIKGNISLQDSEKIYHKPGDLYYNKTRIDESTGERWFCTDKEAENAGWRHSKV